MPKCVILEGRPLIQRFHDSVQMLPVAPTVLFNHNVMLTSLLSSMAYDADAELSLEYEALDMVHDAIGGAWGTDVEVVANGMVDFGRRLLQHMRMHGLYTNGYLPYQHGSWLEHDIVLYRIEPPSLAVGPLHSENMRHWIFQPPPPLLATEPEALPLPLGVARDLSGVYSYVEEDPSPSADR